MRPAKYKKAFTIVELLISLAITALLLTAVATAFNASLQNFQENEEIFQAMNSGRQALQRMTTQLRTADWVNPASPPNECGLRVLAIADPNITYSYNNGKLYLMTDDNLTDPDYVLCDHITKMTFIKDPSFPGANVTSVQISMTVEVGNNQQTVSSAAVIRKNLKSQPA